VNIWYGIVNGYIIDPHFLNDILTGAVYNEFLQQKLPKLLENIDLITQQENVD